MKRLIGKEVGSYVFDASEKTITFSGIGTISQDQILIVSNVNHTTLIYNFADPNKGGSYNPLTGVLTLEYDTSVAMADTDLLLIYIDVDSNGYDTTLDANKILNQTPEWARYTDAEALLTAAQVMTTSFVDCGPEIDCSGYTFAKLWFTLDVNDAVNTRIKVLQKHTFAGTEEYPVCPSRMICSAPSSYVETVGGVNAQYWEIDTDADQLFCILVQVDNATPYLQVQISNGTGTTGEIDALYVTKGR